MKILLIQPNYRRIYAYAKKKEITPVFPPLGLAYIAAVLKKENIEINPAKEDFEVLFKNLDEEKISKEAILDILAECKPVKSVISKYHVLSDSALKSKLKEIIKKNPGLPFNALIGKAMGELRGKAPGKKIAAFLRELSK